MDSALQLFEEEGYDAASVQRIVDEAGLTKGAFYHHFESKEEVLHEIHDQFMDYQLERLRTVVARDEPADVLLRQVMTEVLMEPIGIYRSEITVFLHEQRFLSRDAFSEVYAKRDEFERLVVQLIERGIDEGVFRPTGPPRLVAFAVIGVTAWAHTWLDPKGDMTPREIGDIYGDIIIRGLRSGDSGKPPAAAKRTASTANASAGKRASTAKAATKRTQRS
jgi:TetR/AcrR family transcriptional regulator, cholesterol catabolism regulator